MSVDLCRHQQPMTDSCRQCDEEVAKTAPATKAETVPASAGVAPDRVAGTTIADDEIPSIGAYMTPKHRYYFNRQGPVPSVTTVLDVIDKPGVGIFKAKEAARAVWQKFSSLAAERIAPVWTAESSEDEVVKWALQEADKARDTAADLGSSVHLLADLIGASETAPTAFQVSDDVYPYVNAFRDFLGRYSASSIVSSEHMVWSANGYAGTYDLIMQIEDPGFGSHQPELWLIDIKTSGKGPYPEWGLQLAGYRWADSIILPGNPAPYPMPPVQRTGVLHLRPDLYPDTGWRLIEYPTTYEDDYIAFLAALELYTWKGKGRFTKSRLIGRQKPKDRSYNRLRQNQVPPRLTEGVKT